MSKILYKLCSCFIVLTVFSTLLTGCSSKDNRVNTQQNAVSYVENEDFQNFLGNYYNIAKVQNGYYFFENMTLYYFDTESKDSYVVCNKPNCTHNSSECMAFFNIFKYYPFQLSYYNNSLYVLGWEEEGGNLRHNYIYEISLENYKRKKAAYLFDSTNTSSVSFIIHRGYVYYLKGTSGSLEETTDYLYRVKLGSTNTKREEEIIYEFSGIGASVNGLKASGNNIIIRNDCYGDKQGNNFETSYNLIDINSLETKKIVGNDTYSLFADGEYAYYEKGKNTVNRIDINTNKENFFCEIDGPAYISADSNYIYFDNIQKMYINNDFNDRKILVYDKKGNYITEIVPKNPKDDCYFGGNDVMIFKEIIPGEAVTNNKNQTKAEGYYVLDKSQLTSPDKQFIDME